jgi:uncharacterized protein
MKRSLAALAFLSAAFLGTAPVHAQDAQNPAPAAGQEEQPLQAIMNEELPPERMELAMKLLRLSGTSRVFDQVLPGIAEQAKNYFIRANPQMQLGIIAVVDKVALELVSRRPELDQYFAKVWASAYTDEEMQQLVDFYDSDIGKKFANTFPQILTVQTAAAQEWGKSISADLTEKVQKELRDAMRAEEQALQGDIAGPAAAPAPAPEQPAPQQ